MSVSTQTVKSKVPARMDRLPWSNWHWLMISALGVVWILDGLEVTIKGALGPTLKEGLGLTTAQVGTTATIYLIGAVLGAAVGGYATDRFGRKRVFQWTIVIYLVGVVGTGLVANGFVTFAIFRFITGLGIGGEYAGIHSAIDELLPARVRGRGALAINGSYWIGTLLGSGLATLYLNTLSVDWAWRAGFLTGSALAVGVLMLRAFVPESPRWLMVHGEPGEADDVVSGIERKIEKETGQRLTEPPDDEALELAQREAVGPIELAKLMFGTYPRRSALGGMLMTTQAFLYNAIFFTYGMVLTTYFDVSRTAVGLFLIPFAIGNFLGPVLLGPYFDKIGRKPMISGTYFLSGGLLITLGVLFVAEVGMGAIAFTVGLTIIFFFASAAASSGYMTVSETFPLEIRAQAIAFFYILGTGAGGVVGPWLFGNLITPDVRMTLFYGYLIGAGLMILGGIAELWLGFRAEQKSLEDITDPLSVEMAKRETKRLEGPLGLDPSNYQAIRNFQEQHGISEDGVIGPKTQGAMRALLADADDDEQGDMDVDVTDAASVTDFQRRYNLRPTGEVDEETQGALLALEREPVVNPCDAESVRRFQRAYNLDPTGNIDRATQVALLAIRTERDAGGRADLDVVDRASVKRFENRYGIEPDGVIGPQVRGALKALRAMDDWWAGIDIADPEAVTRFQSERGLPETGVIQGRTRDAMRDEFDRRKRQREQEAPAERGRPEFAPEDVESVRRFQREHSLEAHGEVDEATFVKVREVRAEYVGVDPTDPESIKRFQRDNSLEPDGVMGPVTQGALQARRDSYRLPDPDAEPVEPERQALRQGRDESPREQVDPTDSQEVSRFQKEHSLPSSGVVDEDTQVALRVVAIERARQQEEEGGGAVTAPPGETEDGRPYVQRGMWAGFTYVAATPSQDRDLDTELSEIEQVLRDEGPLSKSELRSRVGSRRWGPGRFRQAFNVAVEEGRIERGRSGSWELAEEFENASV